MSAGFEQLQEALRVVFEVEMPALLTKLQAAQDPTRPMTARELCERWVIDGATPELQLANLARRCRLYGLHAFRGSDGWNALYGRTDVLRAEECGAGKIRSRKSAAKKPATREVAA